MYDLLFNVLNVKMRFKCFKSSSWTVSAAAFDSSEGPEDGSIHHDLLVV